MKKLPLVLILCVSLLGCEKGEKTSPVTDSHLIGNWQLIEMYMDPGGGGSFVPVVSDKIVSFHADGSLSSNGDPCAMDTQSGAATIGTFSVADSTFSGSNCNPDFEYRFSLSGNFLILSYPCIEPCQAKYQKQ